VNNLYHPPLPFVSDLFELMSYWPNYKSLETKNSFVDRICVDRLLLIRERLIEKGLLGGTVLDLGGGTGYFSWVLYITFANTVDLVEDERARSAGYGDDSFTSDFRSKITELEAKRVNIHDQSIEEFLREKAEMQCWDVTLCLSVLHHFITGYGDNPEVGQLEYSELLAIFKLIGKVTKQYAYIEVDDERIGDWGSIYNDLKTEGGFSSMSVIGMSNSAIGVPRKIVELVK
jgi:hypothetical protein